jgi:hypothetical protein
MNCVFWVSKHVNELIWHLRKSTRIELKIWQQRWKTVPHTAEIREFISFQFPCSNSTSTNNVSPRCSDVRHKKHLLVSPSQRDGHAACLIKFYRQKWTFRRQFSKRMRIMWKCGAAFNWSRSIFAGKSLFYLEWYLTQMIIKFLLTLT